MITLTGTVQNGVVVLDGPVPPDGTKLALTVLPEPTPPAQADTPKGSLAFLLELAGTVPDLPPDFAAEHDHYIHGTPRREGPDECDEYSPTPSITSPW